MKKNIQDTNLENLIISSKNELDTSNIKTTDINILLNRVRLDQKKIVKKNIIVSLLFVCLVSSITIFFII